MHDYTNYALNVKTENHESHELMSIEGSRWDASLGKDFSDE